MNKAEEQRIQLVEAGEDAAVPLQAPKQAFHFVAPLIKLPVVRPEGDAGPAGRHHGVKPSAKASWRVRRAFVGPIYHHRHRARRRPQAAEPRTPRGGIVGLPRGKREGQRGAGIRGNQMNLGGPAAADWPMACGPLFFARPGRRTLTLVLSSETASA